MRDRPSGSLLRQAVLAGAVYLLLAVVLWWHAWSAHPNATMTCGCTDAGFLMWFLEWTAYAMGHGHNLWFSTWMLHPTGVNALSNASAPGLGVLLSPVTALVGPVAAMNVGSTLSPALTALSMFVLLQRWTRWGPAAFVGGLAYGFSPFVVVQLAFGWLFVTFLPLLPLMLLCLDELFVRQRRSPRLVGLALGAVVAAEFFVSTELLLLLAIATAVGIVVFAVALGWASARDARLAGAAPAAWWGRLRRAGPGLVTAVVVAVVLLAYPLWFALAGPAHLGKRVWTTAVPGSVGNAPGDFVSSVGSFGPLSARQLSATSHALGGYQGPLLPSWAYLGWGLLAVLVLGCVVWRRDHRLWLLAAVGAVCALLSLKVTGGGWGPWAVLDRLPLVGEAEQARLSAVVDLCAAAMLALIVDHLRREVGDLLALRTGPSVERARVRHARTDRAGGPAIGTLIGSGAGIAAAAVALVPVGLALGPNVPLTMQPVAVPPWFTHQARAAAPAGTGGRLPVVLTYPVATVETPTAMVWQAVPGMAFRMAGGGGPGATLARAGRARPGYAVLTAASFPFGPPPEPTAANLRAVRQALRLWGVTTVVVPNPVVLPTYLRGRSPGYAVGFFTALLGSAPRYEQSAWVWASVGKAPAPLHLPPGAFDGCTSGTRAGDGTAASRCVLGAAATAG